MAAAGMRFLDDVPRFVFFTGKGGVGKTSVACATAVHLARAGRRVLLVSTDPASNVGQVFGLPIGNTITDIDAVPGLAALEIDPEKAAADYRERIIGPVRGLLPPAEVAAITEQLSGSCTTEVAAFNEFTDLLAGPETARGVDHIVFDTAPTGHTIRLLQLPGSWTGFLEAGKGDASCLGPMAGLDKQRASYAAAVAALSDPARTRMVLVTRAQRVALAEAERTRAELESIGITATHLIVNGVLPDDADDDADDDALTVAVRARERAALDSMPTAVALLPRDVIDLKPWNVIGLPALDTLFVRAPSAAANGPVDTLPALADGTTLGALVDAIEADGHGLVTCMGKGGVGKTTLAAAIAITLARRGHPVQLTTTDPAAHLADTIDGAVDGLSISRIDPVEATRAYRERVMATKGNNLDEAGRAALAEDLLSPCTEEVAVFGQFSRVISQSRRQFVVIDTAPTGHTLLLLDAAGSYHREMTRQLGDSMHIRTPLMQLQDPAQTKVLIVTLAEPTPVLEAAELKADLERAGIHPWAWVVNNSLAAAHPVSPFATPPRRHRSRTADPRPRAGRPGRDHPAAAGRTDRPGPAAPARGARVRPGRDLIESTRTIATPSESGWHPRSTAALMSGDDAAGAARADPCRARPCPHRVPAPRPSRRRDRPRPAIERDPVDQPAAAVPHAVRLPHHPEPAADRQTRQPPAAAAPTRVRRPPQRRHPAVPSDQLLGFVCRRPVRAARPHARLAGRRDRVPAPTPRRRNRRHAHAQHAVPDPLGPVLHPTDAPRRRLPLRHPALRLPPAAAHPPRAPQLNHATIRPGHDANPAAAASLRQPGAPQS
jgi:arsenite-transporting ATPase